MLQVQETGEVTHKGAVTFITKDSVPSRREVETAMMRLRAKHGSVSGHELDVLWRALTRDVFSTKEQQHD